MDGTDPGPVAAGAPAGGWPFGSSNDMQGGVWPAGAGGILSAGFIKEELFTNFWKLPSQAEAQFEIIC